MDVTPAPVAPVDTVGAFMGTPRVLRAGAPGGPLAGTTIGVKDVFDIAGLVTGAGTPAFAAGRPPAERDATAVTRLIVAGTTVVGKTVTDELTWSLAGVNVHYGAPRNVAAPGRRAGGSSSGSAAAVAAGLVDLGLGTDCGGSIRVPASQCGIVGWRPTHGAVPTDGVFPLAPSFDTVALLARDPHRLQLGAAALLDPGRGTAPADGHLVGIGEVWAGASDAVRAGLTALVPSGAPPLGLDLARAADAFRTCQAWEVWRGHGRWFETTHPDLAPEIAARFQYRVARDRRRRRPGEGDRRRGRRTGSTRPPRAGTSSCTPPRPGPRRRSSSRMRRPRRGVPGRSSSRAWPA